MRISQVVPLFCCPITKKTGVPAGEGPGGRPSGKPCIRASSLLSAAISPSLRAICLLACLLALDRMAFAAAPREDLATRSARYALRLPKIVIPVRRLHRDARRPLASPNPERRREWSPALGIRPAPPSSGEAPGFPERTAARSPVAPQAGDIRSRE